VFAVSATYCGACCGSSESTSTSARRRRASGIRVEQRIPGVAFRHGSGSCRRRSLIAISAWVAAAVGDRQACGSIPPASREMRRWLPLRRCCRSPPAVARVLLSHFRSCLGICGAGPYCRQRRIVIWIIAILLDFVLPLLFGRFPGFSSPQEKYNG